MRRPAARASRRPSRRSRNRPRPPRSGARSDTPSPSSTSPSTASARPSRSPRLSPHDRGGGLVTAQAGTAPRRPFGAAFRGLPFHPAEGWLALAATALMTMVFAGSLVDARWVGTRPQDNTTYLIWLAVVGVLFGFGGAKVGWGRWRTILVGATFAGLTLPLIVGGIVRPDLGLDPHGLAARYAVSYEVARHVWTDLIVLNRSFTTEYAHYHLVFGALVWGGGILAGYAVFGHRRPLDAVVVLGLALRSEERRVGKECRCG